MPRFSTLVVLTWRQPLASSVARSAAPRLEASSRPRYTRRAALTVGDSMIVDLAARYVSPFGTGMSSNSLRAGFVGADAHAPRSRTTSSVPTSLCGLMPGAYQATQGTAREFGPRDLVELLRCESAGGS